MQNINQKIGIAIHGGATRILPITISREKEIREALAEALNKGYKILEEEGSALDAVEAAIVVLEDSPYFNAGRGAAFTEIGENELHAAIMCGNTTDCGAISAVKNIKNPISLAKAILHDSENLFLCSEGAMKFAKEHNIKTEPDSYFVTDHMLEYWEWKKRMKGKSTGTVGAVARDRHGNLAAGTSTGGLQDASCQRVSDSAIVGAGTFADNSSCAISCTGDGEYFIRTVFGHTVSDLMLLKNLSLKEAIEIAVKEKLEKFKADVGIIGIDTNGNIETFFNAERMYRAWKSEGTEGVVKIFRGE